MVSGSSSSTSSLLLCLFLFTYVHAILWFLPSFTYCFTPLCEYEMLPALTNNLLQPDNAKWVDTIAIVGRRIQALPGQILVLN